ncbi:integrase_H2C2 domain-containing protein [Trichonephila clavipes]|nr:integrase_H2C2 domain-containing protein [Trichonephila clavipes]
MLESKEILSPLNQPTWLVHTVGVSEAEKGTLLEEEKKVPVLGLIWKPDKDTLSVNWEENSKSMKFPLKENWGTFCEQQGTRNTSTDQPSRLKHIPGILNPADLPSRGMWCSRTYCIVMVCGPSWLLNKPREEWPLSEVRRRSTKSSESKNRNCAAPR